MSTKLLFFLMFLFIFLIKNDLYSNSQGYRDELPQLQKLTDLTVGIKRINKGLKYESKGKDKKANKMYNEAISFLLKANKNQSIDPNIFFYLGFAYNKLKNFDNAKTYYILGLTIDPTHSHLNKYLGELYLKLDKVDLAKERLKILKNCNCEEFLDLNKLILEYKS